MVTADDDGEQDELDDEAMQKTYKNMNPRQEFRVQYEASICRGRISLSGTLRGQKIAKSFVFKPRPSP